jgi:hypothetical protein
VNHQIKYHCITIVIAVVIFGSLIILVDQKSNNEDVRIGAEKRAQHLLQGLDFHHPLHRALLKETYGALYPGRSIDYDSLFRTMERQRSDQFANRDLKSGGQNHGIIWSEVGALGIMYLQFIIVYILVVSASYYAAQAFGIYMFIKRKQGLKSSLSILGQKIIQIGKAIKRKEYPWENVLECCTIIFMVFIKCCAYLIMFTPAYVLAYMMKANLESGRYILMIILGTISNGVLINYAHKFYLMLRTENRKGYVETAIVKGLNNSYSWNTEDGISLKSLIRWNKAFTKHAFSHIYQNARFQYRLTMKQYASLIITGLMIIEMALNLQGHFSYQLLQDVYYHRYTNVLMSLFGIFLIVKITELGVDYMHYRESLRYENVSTSGNRKGN